MWSFFWIVFSRTQAEYEDLLSKSLTYSARVRQSKDQKNLCILTLLMYWNLLALLWQTFNSKQDKLAVEIGRDALELC